MQGSAEVIEVLNEILTAELTAINQYFVHGKLCESWGYQKLASKARADSVEEMHDADRIIGRIIYLGGMPNLQRLAPVGIGESVPEQFALDLELELAAIERYNRAIRVAVEAADNGTRELCERHLLGEETHADWVQTQQGLIEQLGLEAYLAQQL